VTYEELGPLLQGVGVAQAADEIIDVAGSAGNSSCPKGRYTSVFAFSRAGG
jgi:hypothetical protein